MNIINIMVWSQIEVHIGPGGTGKTHNQIIDTGLVGVGYFTPSWKLLSKKIDEYSKYDLEGDVWAGLLSKNPARWKYIQYNYNVLIIDEISMMSYEDQLLILDRFSKHKIIFCGDLGYQLPPINEENGEEVECFKILPGMMVTEWTTLYRCLCPTLEKILFKLRKFIDEKKQFTPGFKIDWSQQFNGAIAIHGMGWVQENYNYEKDLIICKSHRACDYYTNLFKDKPKYKIKKRYKNYCNGDIVVNDLDIPESFYEKRHGFTIHSIQGETCENRLFIETCGIYDLKMLYTALSRARYAKNIILIATNWKDLEIN